MVSLVSGTKRHDYFIWKTVVWHTVTGKMLSGTKQLQSTEPLSGRICLEQNILSSEGLLDDLFLGLDVCAGHAVGPSVGGVDDHGLPDGGVEPPVALQGQVDVVHHLGPAPHPDGAVLAGHVAHHAPQGVVLAALLAVEAVVQGVGQLDVGGVPSVAGSSAPVG